MTPIYATSNSMGEVSRAKALNALPLFFFLMASVMMMMMMMIIMAVVEMIVLILYVIYFYCVSDFSIMQL